ncbi:hypothetical protein ISN44_As04g012020, partial [Arabidopsis suecica]
MTYKRLMLLHKKRKKKQMKTEIEIRNVPDTEINQEQKNKEEEKRLKSALEGEEEGSDCFGFFGSYDVSYSNGLINISMGRVSYRFVFYKTKFIPVMNEDFLTKVTWGLGVVQALESYVGLWLLCSSHQLVTRSPARHQVISSLPRHSARSPAVQLVVSRL